MLALSPDQKQALKGPRIRVDTLLQMNLDSGTERYWSGSGMLDYDGAEWLGCGHISAIQGLEDTTDPNVSQIQIIVMGIDPEAIAYLQTDLKGQTATLYDAVMDRNERVIGDAIVADEIDLDFAKAVPADDGTFTIVVEGQSGFWQLEKASNAVWSPDRIRDEFPDETGLDGMPELEDKVTLWTKT